MNVELAQAALEAAKGSPKNFRMETFFSGLPEEGITKDAPGLPPLCGTTACFAGFASLLHAPQGTWIAPGYSGTQVHVPGQEPVHVEDYAIKALEINPDQAGALFFLANIREVETAVNYLADNPDVGGGTLWDIASGPEDDEGADEDDWIYE